MAKAPHLNPYLTVKGADGAIAFYKKAFGAKEHERLAAPDGKRVMHAALSINGGIIMLSDEFIEHDGASAPTVKKPSPVAIAVHYLKPAEVDAAFKRAVEAGCKGTLAPHDTFWDARFAMLADPFGHRWMLNAQTAKKKAKKKKK